MGCISICKTHTKSRKNENISYNYSNNLFYLLSPLSQNVKLFFVCFTCFQLLDNKTQTEDELQNGGMEISSEKRRGRVQRKQRNGGRREEKRQREEGVEQCVAGQRAGAECGVGRRGGEAGTLTDICWHAADAGGGTVPWPAGTWHTDNAVAILRYTLRLYRTPHTPALMIK